jgi:hypothetical protein
MEEPSSPQRMDKEIRREVAMQTRLDLDDVLVSIDAVHASN